MNVSIDQGGLGLAFAFAAEPLLAIDPLEDRIVAANEKAAKLLGYPSDALCSLRATALHPGQRPALIVFTEAAIAKGSAWTHQLSPQHSDGRLLRFEYSAVPLPVGGGHWLMVALHDVEERARRLIDQEADLYMRSGIEEWQRSERFFRDIERENRLILQAAGEGIYGVNTDGITTFVNPAAERMLGWKAAEIVGREMHATVHHSHPDGSSYPHRDCPIYLAFRDGIVHKVDTEVFWCKDGAPLWVEYTSTPIRDRGRMLGAVIVFRDITLRRESEEKLRAALAEVDQLRQRLELENAYLQEEIRLGGGGIIGSSAATQQVLRQIDLVAGTDATVLITGESGTGKELIARAIHEASGRSARPLIRVNCAAIPRELFESEFFGHVKGAFTGAIRDRVGRFELADGATLFLDEVGEIPLELQGKLLRVLQEQQFERVGEERTRHVDVRIIAATNRSLKEEITRGKFREDLFYRLNVFPIAAVALRDRPDDIAPIAQHLLDAAVRKLRIGEVKLTGGDVARLKAYAWPGNVRELENAIERAAILSKNGRLNIELPQARHQAEKSAPAPLAVSAAQPLKESERRQRDRENIVAALAQAGGRIFGQGGAAEILGIKPTTLASRIKKLGISAHKAGKD